MLAIRLPILKMGSIGSTLKLEEASEKYKELTALAKEIEKDLAEMKNEIKVIEEDFSK